LAAEPDLDPLIQKALIVVLVLPFVAVVVLFFGYVKLYRVPSSAMEPTFHCARPNVGCAAGRSDHLVALRFRWPFRGVRRRDIVAVRVPEAASRACGTAGTYLKRVIGLPGETVAEQNGAILVDGRRLREPYVKRRDGESFTRRRVPEGSYFLLGDARRQSCDSRVWGPARRRSLIARVVGVYWPPSRIGVR
jgi:signal peptidase I